MKRVLKRVLKIVRFLPVTLPLVFMFFFFGALPLSYDVVIYTDNIVGEGTCCAYISSPKENFSYLYMGNAYFGSELKTLRIKELRYDVDTVTLDFYGVTDVDFLSFDISVFNVTVSHVSGEGLTHPFTKTVSSATLSTEEPLLHVHLDEPEGGDTITLSGFRFIPLWLWIAYFAVIFLVSLLLALGAGYLADRRPSLRLPLVSAAALLAALILGGFFCGSLPYVNYICFLMNWMILLALSLFISALTLPWIGPFAITALTEVWYVANFFVLSFRNRPIMPADLRAVSTAMEVASGYSLRPTWQMVVSLVLIAAYCAGIALTYYKNKPGKKTWKKALLYRGAAAALAVLLVFGCMRSRVFAGLNTFAWDVRVTESFHREGVILSFMKNAVNSRVKKPESYSLETVNSYLAEYPAEETEGIRPTKIIMVMNEAFSDLRTVGLDERIDVMPFIDSLVENTVKGDLYVSIFAGGTCNSEFEALTGNSLAFLGNGTYPYTANVSRPLFSLASYLKGQGYSADAFHANFATNWNRDRVYPLLGFDRFHTMTDLADFAPPVYVHSLPADIGDYRYMESVAAGYGDAPAFLFDVTMQNHSGYSSFHDLEEDATVKEFGSELVQDAQVYLSLIKASDDAVRELVEHYRDSDEPTMIVFFGDHQPGLSIEAKLAIYTQAGYILDLYKTRFFIWTNYPTETEMDVAVSANYLPYLILERGNFPLPPYVQLLREVHEQYPIISAMGVVDAEGNIYASVNELPDDPLLHKYRCVQYANMFDEIDPAWFAVG